MLVRENRMLHRSCLEQGTSKSALARQLGVSRDTIHRWIRNGDLDRDLEAEAVRYGGASPSGRAPDLDASHAGACVMRNVGQEAERDQQKR
jgi:transposase-like protein